MITYVFRMLPRALYAHLTANGDRVSRVRRRVRASELDLNLHMNQAVYPHVLEIGRTHLFLNSGAWLAWREAGLNPVVAEQTLTYRRELKPFARYTIDSRVVGIDGRFLVVEGHVLVGRQVHTRGVARLLFVGSQGVVGAEELAIVATPWLTDKLAVDNWQVQ